MKCLFINVFISFLFFQLVIYFNYLFIFIFIWKLSNKYFQCFFVYMNIYIYIIHFYLSIYLSICILLSNKNSMSLVCIPNILVLICGSCLSLSFFLSIFCYNILLLALSIFIPFLPPSVLYSGV